MYKVQTESDKYKNSRPAQKADCDAHVGNINLGSYQEKDGKSLGTET